ncbi:MAG: hypothetical protein ACRCZB_06575, partial [Bacteroidales bacterium]
MKRHIALLFTAVTMLFMFSACSEVQNAEITDKTDSQDESSITETISFSESKNEDIDVADKKVLEEISSEIALEEIKKESQVANKKEETA